MKIKQAGGIAAVIAVLGWTGIAQADHLCAAEAKEIREAASAIACSYGDYATSGGEWNNQAIWQFGKDGDGCKVHQGIAQQLFDRHGRPPKYKGENRSGSKDNPLRFAKGAAAALLDHKFEEALLHLQNVVDTIDSAARLNTEFGKLDGKDAADWALSVRNFAANMKLAIYDPDTGTGCSVQ